MPAEPFPSRLAVPLDTYRALVQMQIDYYATQGNAGEAWTLRAGQDIAAAFCLIDSNACPGHVASDNNPKVCRVCGVHVDEEAPESAPASSLSPWLSRAREAQLAEAAALQREAQADKDDEAAGDWTR